MNLSSFRDIHTWYNPRKKRFWALVLIVLYTLGGFFLVPWVLKRELPGLAQQFLLRDADVQEVRFNPWTLRLQANDFELRDTDGSALAAFSELVVNFQTRSLFQLALVFREVSLTRPEINLKRFALADSNFGRMLEDMAAAAATSQTTAAPAEDSTATGNLRLVVDQLSINNGRVDLYDEMPDTPFNTQLEPINISISDLSTLPDKTGAQQISIITETGASLRWTGSLQVTPLLSSGRIEISGSPLPLIHRYFSQQLGFTLDDCCMEVALNYEVAAVTDGNIEARVADFSLNLQELALLASGSGDPILTLPDLRVSGGEVRWPEKTVRIGEILFDRPEINVWIDSEGVLSLNTLLVTAATDAGATDGDGDGDGEVAATAAADTEATTTTTGTAVATVATTADTDSAETAALATNEITVPAEPGAAAVADDVANDVANDVQPDDWDISLGALRIAGLRFAFTDDSLPESGQLRIPDAEISILEISNRPGAQSPFAISAQVGDSGSVKLDGSLTVLPAPELAASLAIADIAVPDLQPWIQSLAFIAVNDGQFNMSGTLASTAEEQLDLQADIHVVNLSISDTLENEPLVGWNKLGIEQTRLQLSGRRLEISEIRLDQPFARLVIAADGTTNFQALGTNAADPATDAEAEPVAQPETATADSKPFVVQVGKTTISNSSIDFSDFSLPLPFRAPVSELGGELSALASNSSSPSSINLEGKVGEYGLVTVGGSLSVMNPTDKADVEVIFQNINMPDLSPYTAQFAGRKIESGKLNLDLNYGFDSRKMTGKNEIVLEKFALGDKVDNPEAMSLPLDLAVALLKDVNGVIDIKLNISGDLDDPQFSAAGIVMKAFANLITKAVAAPFKLLGALVPGGKEVDFDAVNFQAGKSKLTPPQREKIDLLSAALAQRPNLLLTVPGGYNPELDTLALQQQALDKQLAELLGNDAADNQEMLTRRTRKALEKLAKQYLPELSLSELRGEFTRAPADGQAAFDELAYMDALRSRLEAVQIVDNAQLVELAQARRTAIIEQLTADGSLAPGRIAAAPVTESGSADGAWVRLELSLEIGDLPEVQPATADPASDAL